MLLDTLSDRPSSDRVVPLERLEHLLQRSYGKESKSRVSPMGSDDAVPVDEADGTYDMGPTAEIERINARRLRYQLGSL